MKKLHLFLIIAIVAIVACLLGGMMTMTAAAETMHTVTFMTDDVVYETQPVADGAKAVIPVTPEVEGKAFLYWAKEGTARYSFKTPVTVDVELHAVWLSGDGLPTFTPMYTVDFRVDDLSVNTQNVKEHGSAIAPTDFDLPAGKTFVEWQGTYTDVTADVVVNAVLTDSVYTVTIYGLDEVLLAERTVVYGGSVDLGDLDTTVAHYTLDSESAQAALSNITADTAVYLDYAPCQYAVRCLVDDQVFGDVQQVAYGDRAAFPAIPQKDGYIFIGWYRDLSDTVMYDFGSRVSADLDLYAKFLAIENKKYQVRFFNYDGMQYGGTQRVEEGQRPVEPGAPYREGYVFTGWFLSGDVNRPFGFDDAVYADVDAYAVFGVRTYTVTVYNGDTVTTQQVRYGEDATEPMPIDKEGYTFVGWDSSFRNVTSDVEIHAMYRVITYAVMFYDYDFSKIGATQSVEYGQSAVAPADPYREGYEFTGWQPSYDNITESIAIFAQYRRLTYTVTFVDGESTDVQTINHGETATMPVPNDKDGWLFEGWYEGDQAFDFNAPITRAYTLTARWVEKPQEVCVVTFHVDNEVYSQQTVAKGGAAIAPSNPTKEGYTFTGWDVSFAVVDTDVDVHAQFEIIVCVVTFIVGDSKTEVPCNYGDCVNASSDPEQDGHTFAGWVTKSGAAFDLDTVICENVTLYAAFTPNLYTVTFRVEQQDYDVQTVSYGETATVPANPTKTGHSFLRWAKEGEDEAFDFNAPITGNVVVVAEWSVVTYDLEYYVNGELYLTQQYAYGAQVTPPAEPEHDKWNVFSGWTSVPATMPAQRVRIYATMTPIAHYTLSYYVAGRLYKQVDYAKDESITPEAAPTSEAWVFVAWVDLPATMPESDLSVSAQLRYYYTVTYQVGQTSFTQRVLQGAAISAVDDPEDEAWVFDGWSDIPDVMPDEDVMVTAKLRYYRVITYYLDGQVYRTDRLLQGDAVPAVTAPQAPQGWYFVGWSETPTVMPNADVAVYGSFAAVAVANDLVWRQGDDGSYTLVLTGIVRLGGVLCYLEGDVLTAEVADSDYAAYNLVDGGVRFVWSQGVNATTETVLLTLTVQGDTAPTVQIIEIYAYDDAGDIVTATYHIEGK